MSNRLGDLISLGEGGYNSYNRGTRNGHILAANQAIDFSQMSLDELQRRQSLPSDDLQRVFAVGKYQVIPKTLSKAIADLNLRGDERFSAAIQERIFADYLIAGKRPAISKYIQGIRGADLHSALKATCKEWASVEDVDTPGKPYGLYGQQGNRATTKAADVATALIHMRGSYLADIGHGLAPGDAWRSVTGQVEDLPAIEVATSNLERSSSSPAHPHPSRPPDHVVTHVADNSILHVQHTLARLGYSGAHAEHIVADGHFGPQTKHAVLAFQQAHHLHPDGIVGKHTLAALEHARHAPLLSEATHPQHGLFVQALHGVHALPGKTFGSAHEQHNAAASLTVAAHAAGLHRIDHVVLGTDAVRLFAVEGRMDDPAHRRVHVDRMQAITQTVEQGTRAMERVAMQEPVHSHAAFVAMQEQVDHRGATLGIRP